MLKTNYYIEKKSVKKTKKSVKRKKKSRKRQVNKKKNKSIKRKTKVSRQIINFDGGVPDDLTQKQLNIITSIMLAANYKYPINYGNKNKDYYVKSSNLEGINVDDIIKYGSSYYVKLLSDSDVYSDVELIRQIGSGASAKVYLCSKSGQYICIKVTSDETYSHSEVFFWKKLYGVTVPLTIEDFPKQLAYLELPLVFCWDTEKKSFIVPKELNLSNEELMTIKSHLFMDVAIDALLVFKKNNLFPGDFRARHVGLMYSSDKKLTPVIIDMGTSIILFEDDDFMKYISKSEICADPDFGDAFTIEYKKRLME
jgi:hypothetical protein